jgi:hypothetical protein
VTNDPDVRRLCKVCGSPIYVDEPPGCYCPDCADARRRLAEALRPGAPRAGPRVVRVLDGAGERSPYE